MVTPPTTFTAYMRLWCITNLLRISIGMNAGTGLVGSTLDRGAIFLPGLVLAAGVLPSRWSGALPAAALTVRALTNLAKGAMMSNSQMWATQMDAALLVALAAQRMTSTASWRAPLTATDERAVVGACARTIRWQLAIFYFASGWWKLNTSFLSVDYSCASLFTVQPLEYLPDSVLFATEGIFGALVPMTARLIATIAPAMTLVIEAVVPALHFLEPTRWPVCARLGVGFTLVFHLIIGLTPPPSNVSTYGVTTCTRLFFVMPDALALAVAELTAGSSKGYLLGASMAAAAAMSLALVAPLHAAAVSTVQGEGVDWHLGYYAMMCVLFGRAMLLEVSGAIAEKTMIVEGGVYKKLVGLACVYAFVLPMLGLQEKAGCLMFSQLRLHGGSNHVRRLGLDAPVPLGSPSIHSAPLPPHSLWICLCVCGSSRARVRSISCQPPCCRERSSTPHRATASPAASCASRRPTSSGWATRSPST